MTQLRTLRLQSRVRTLQMASDASTFLAGCNNSLTWLWSMESGQCKQRLETGYKGVCYAGYHGSQIVTAEDTGNVLFWCQISMGRPGLHASAGHVGGVADAVLLQRSPTQTEPTVCGTIGVDGTIRIWDLDSGYCERTLEGSCALVSSDGSYVVAGGADGTIRIHDRLTAECLHTLTYEADHQGSPYLRFSHNGTQVIAMYGPNQNMRFVLGRWCVQSGHLLRVRVSDGPHPDQRWRTVMPGDGPTDHASASSDAEDEEMYETMKLPIGFPGGKSSADGVTLARSVNRIDVLDRRGLVRKCLRRTLEGELDVSCAGARISAAQAGTQEGQRLKAAGARVPASG